MRRRLAWLLVFAAGCTFEPSGSIGDDAASTPDADRTGIDAAQGVADAAVADAPVNRSDAAIPDASPPDAEIPDAAPPDADPCAGCDDGVSCTNDVCDPGVGVCMHQDACAAGQACDSVDDRCEGTLTFQNGAGYSGTHDTNLMEANPDATSGGQTFGWDADEPNGSDNEYIGMLRFANVVGAGADEVPAGATIISATLGLTVENDNPTGLGGAGSTVTELAVTWDEGTATWNNIGGDAGLQPAELGVEVASFAAIVCVPPCPLTIDVTASVGRWAAGTTDNYGWAFQTAGNNGLYVYSSEASAPDRRPRLTVEFAVP